MADVAPIGPAEYHVKAEDCDARSVIVLIENPLELHVQQGCAFLETNAPRRIETATLANTTSALFK